MWRPSPERVFLKALFLLCACSKVFPEDPFCLSDSFQVTSGTSSITISVNNNETEITNLNDFTINVTQINSAENKSVTFENLTPGTEYNFTFVGLCNHTQGYYTRPNPPGNVTTAARTNSSISIAWDMPVGMVDSMGFSYIVYSNILSNESTKEEHRISQLTITLDSLTCGTQYNISVETVGPTNLTSEKVYMTPYTLPNPVHELRLGPVSTNTVSLQWEHPACVQPNNFYRVCVMDRSNCTNETSTQQNNAVITNLQPGTIYNFTVTTVASNDTDSEIRAVSATTKPDIIRNLNITQITTSSVSLEWLVPQGLVSFYRVEWNHSNEVKNTSTNSTSVNITDLTPGTQYRFGIVAVAADNTTEGATTSISLFTKPDIIRNLNITQITTSSVSLEWLVPQGLVSFYRVEWNHSNEVKNTSTNSASVNIMDLTPGTQYRFGIVAVAADNTTEGATTSISLFTKPDIIRNLNITQITTSSVSLEWLVPQGLVSFYRVEWNHNNEVKNTSTNSASVNIIDLTPGTQYRFGIVAVAADNTTEGATTSISLFTKPDIIRNLNITQITTSSVSLEWLVPQGLVSFYRVEWNHSNEVKNTSTNSASVNIMDLTPGTQYRFGIVAVAADNTTEGATTSISLFTKPDIIRNLNITQITTSSVSLEWLVPQGLVSFYRVEWNHNNEVKNTSTNSASVNIIDLTPGTQYRFGIVAVAADNTTEGATTSISLFTKPDIIRNLNITQITTSSVSLEWLVPQGLVSFYRVEWNHNNDVKKTSTNSTSVNITDLTPGTQYRFGIVAVAADNTTEGATTSISLFTKPDIIRNLNITQITTSSVSLEWLVPQGLVSFYRVEWNHNNEVKNTSTNATSVNITDLTPGTQYRFGIVAVAADNTTEGATTSISLFTKPDIIRNLNITQITTSSVSLEWLVPQGLVSFYRVEWNHNNDVKKTSTNSTSVNITDLTPGTQYRFGIVAVAADNTTEGATTSISLFTKPDIIRNLNITQITTSSVSLEWLVPQGLVSFYRVEWNHSNEVKKTSTNLTSVNITDLTPGTQYRFGIVAVAADNTTEGATTSISLFTKPDIIRNLNITQITTSSVSLEWLVPQGLVSFYRVEWNHSNEVKKTSTNLTSVNITDLTPGTQYRFGIVAVAADNTTEGATTSISLFTKPDIIRNLNITQITTSSVSLEWLVPQGLVSFYRVEWNHSNEVKKTSTNLTSVNITDLTPGTQYRFGIVAVAADNTTEGATTSISLFTKPDIIRNLNITQITTSSVSLEWLVPQGLVSFYRVEWNHSNEVKKTSTNSTSVNITDLTPGTQYRFGIVAVAADNTTEGATTSISLFTKPDIIRNLNITQITTSSVSLEWLVPQGLVSFYRVEWNHSNEVKKTSTNLTSVNITDLTPGTQYRFGIVAVAADNTTEGATTSISLFTKPDIIRNLNITQITTSSVSLEWLVPQGLVSFYRVEWNHSNEVKKTSTNLTSVNITDLTPGTQYRFGIVAVAADNTTEGATTSISLFTKPDIIRNLNITQITTSSVSLEWLVPQGLVSFYRVEWNHSNEVKKTSTNSTSVNITDLTPGTQYRFGIVAVAADNTTEGATTSISLFTKPDIIRNLNITQITTSSVSLEWLVPQGLVSFYRVEWNHSNEVKKTSTNLTSVNITDLTPGTQYRFGIVAVAADNTTEGATTSISLFTKPDIIRNLNITQITTSSVSLEWLVPQGLVSFYRVEWNHSNEVKKTSTNSTSVNITDLTPGTQYRFGIVAVAADNTTEGATTSISLFTKPDIIRNLNITQITTSSVSLEWLVPQGLVSFYRVEWNHSNEVKKTSTNLTSVNITDLTPGTQYRFGIVAVAADNTTEGATTSISLFTKPDIIRNLNITQITTSSVSLEWLVPQGLVSFYRVEWNYSNEVKKTSTNSTSVNITDLTPGTQYRFGIVAVAADNTTEGATTSISLFTKPDIIRNLNITQITTSSVSLEWLVPQGLVSFYRIEWNHNNEVKKTSTNSTSVNITDLTPGTQYRFGIVAVAADNTTEGATTSISLFTKPDIIRNLNITQITTSSVSLEWLVPQGLVSFYRVEWNHSNEVKKTSTNLTSVNITDLTPGTQYRFGIVAVAADNTTEGATTSISLFTKPDIIRNLNITQITTSSVSLEWLVPQGLVSFYRVEWNHSNEVKKTSTNLTSVNITDLTPGTQYRFGIVAVAADNTTEGATTSISLFTKPDIIRNLNITQITTSSVSLEWLVPQGLVSFYRVEWNHNNEVKNTSTNATSVNITDLTPGTQYRFGIVAVAADNTTEGATTSISLFTKPDIIRNLNITQITTSSVSLEWLVPQGLVSFYRVEWNHSNEVKNTSTNATSVNITDLTPGTQYRFGIVAVAADNTTEGATTSISLFTNAAPVRNFTCRGPSLGGADLLYSWIEPIGSHSGVVIQTNDVLDFSPMCNDQCSHIVSNLLYDTMYRVRIWTLGPGKNSTVTEISCKTGITVPPEAKVENNVILTNAEFNKFVLQLDESIFNSSNGQIKNYGVLVSSESVLGKNKSVHLRKTYNNNTGTYLAVVKDYGTNRNSKDVITVTLGDETKWNEYTNGPLNAGQTYRYAVVIFTQLELQDGLISILNSYFSISELSGPVHLKENPASNGGMIAGIVLAILIIITVILLVVYWKRRTKPQLPEIPIQSLRARISVAIRVEDYEAYQKKQRADSNCGFAEEFEDLKTVGVAQTKASALMLENKGKNRYNNVLPYDFSRVKLSPQGSPYDDYINANYMPGYFSKKEYIAAQGPLPCTTSEFWRMIWEKNVHTLVMLTRCNEQGRVKCEQYWCSESQHFGNIIVTMSSEITLEDWTIRDFVIKNVKTVEVRQVRQFHFTAWPDHGVPNTTELLINFRHLVREHMEQHWGNSPTVVHCSAGVGRTGTFIAIDRLIFQIERENMVDVYGIVHDLRLHRPLMVQTEEQYIFLHQCALDHIKSRSGTNVDLIYQNTGAFQIYENAETLRR